MGLTTGKGATWRTKKLWILVTFYSSQDKTELVVEAKPKPLEHHKDVIIESEGQEPTFTI